MHLRSITGSRARVMLLAAMVFGLSACGGGSDSPSVAAPAQPETRSEVAAVAPVRIDAKITPGMLRKVGAPPKPDNGALNVQPGTGGRFAHQHAETAQQIQNLRRIQRLTREVQ